MLCRLRLGLSDRRAPTAKPAGRREGQGRAPAFENYRTDLRGDGSRPWRPVRGSVPHAHVFIQARRTHENVQKHQGVRSGIFTNTFSTLAAAWGKEATLLLSERRSPRQGNDSPRITQLTRESHAIRQASCLKAHAPAT